MDMSIDYGVTSDAKVTLTDWSKPDADIMGDIQKMVAIGENNGYVVNKALTSLKMINYMRNNTAMQTIQEDPRRAAQAGDLLRLDRLR